MTTPPSGPAPMLIIFGGFPGSERPPASASSLDQRDNDTVAVFAAWIAEPDAGVPP